VHPLLRRLAALLLLIIVVAVAASLFVYARDGPGAVKEPSLPPGPTRRLVERLLPSIVDVRVAGGRLTESGETGIGTGIVYDRLGHIVTNDHVVTVDGARLAGEVYVIAQRGRRIRAALVARFPAYDLALLRIDAALPPARFVRSFDAIRVGQAVVAVGAPRTLEASVARGRIVAVESRVRLAGRPALTTLIMTSARVRPGYSGGPLLNRGGRVLGVSIGITVTHSGKRLGLAIPAPLVVEVIGGYLQSAAQRGAVTMGARVALVY
jgi:S1-C subfamily serine protease